MKNRQHLAASREIGDLRVGAGEVPMQVQLLAVMLRQERDVARHESRVTLADEQAEIVPLDVLDQYLRTRFGEGGGQVNHAIVSRCEPLSLRRQLICAISGAASSAAPDSKRMVPEARLIHFR